jgi:hypothetical protein
MSTPDTVQSYRVSQVFVPGGLPKYTYVPRDKRGLEDKLLEADDNLCKITTVTGSTKSGKTVLLKKTFDKKPALWCEGAHITSMEVFWELLGDQLGALAESELEHSTESENTIFSETSIEGNALIAKGTAKIGGERKAGKTSRKTSKLVISKPSQVIKALKAQRPAVIIDDFHYISRDLQGKITRSLKPLVFDGITVIFLAIPHRRYDAIKVEREMNGRINLIEVPAWDEAELLQISELGFPLLNVVPNLITSKHLADHAHGSPHLMQEFCKHICLLSDFKETVHPKRTLDATFDYTKIFKRVANELGKNIFDKLAKGPRPRTDRLPRTLKSGKTADIYRVILIALSHMAPGVSTIEYEPLRGALREILASDLPQAHEVSRVLEQMAKVSSTDESSVAVIDYEKDERKLHITDPFFAFFLRWGKDIIEI